MSGTLYTSWKDALGGSHIDEPVAVFENGKIYTAADGFLGTTAKGVLIGEYEGGIVYTVGTGAFNYGKRLKAVALIEYGKIYSLSKSILGGISKSLSVGECSCGKVYSHSHKIMDGSESFGLYNGDAEGAAAAAAIALFKLESNVSANDSALTGRSSSGSSSDDDEDLWEKYGLLMPIVVTFRFFKYSFIVGKWIVGAIAWLTAGVIRLVQNHKDKKALKEKTIETSEKIETDESVGTRTTEKNGSSIYDCEAKDRTVGDISENRLKRSMKTSETTEEPFEILKNFLESPEAVGDFIDKNFTETDKNRDVDSSEIEITKSKKKESSSKLKSTMRSSVTATSVKETNGFKPAGDL